MSEPKRNGVSDDSVIIYEAKKRWLNNENPDNLGIVQFSQELFPYRIDTRFGVPQMHKDIYLDLLTALTTGASKLDRLHAIAAPREHSKSTIICFVFVLYCILFDLKKYIVIISESDDKTAQFLRAIKKALALPAVRYYFPHITAHSLKEITDGKKWTETHIVTSNGIHVRALGMGMSTRGLIEDSRPDLMIADDVESENNTKTKQSRDNNYKWWKAQAVPACDMINGQCVYIGTMVHSDCILAHLMQQESYHKRFYQVWIDQKRTKTLWPEKFPPQLVRQIEREFSEDAERGPDMFYMEYMNVAVSPSSRVFGPKAIIEMDYHFIMNALGKWVHVPAEGKYYACETFIGIDPAISKNDRSCYTVVLVLAALEDGRLFILEYDRDHLDIRDDEDTGRRGTIESTCGMILAYRPARVIIEVNGLGQPIANELRREMDKLREEHPEIGYPMLYEVRPPATQSKEERIQNILASPYKLRKVVQRPTMVEHRTELETFPKSMTLDNLDALSNAVANSHTPYNTLEYTTNLEQQAEREEMRARMGRSRTAPVCLDWEVM